MRMNTRPLLKPWVKCVSLALTVSVYIFRSINLSLEVRRELLLRNNKPLEHERTRQIKQVKVLKSFLLGEGNAAFIKYEEVTYFSYCGINFVHICADCLLFLLLLLKMRTYKRCITSDVTSL